MKAVGLSEARTHFYELLRRAENGERITITRRGVPVAVLRSVNPDDREQTAEAIQRIAELGRGKTASGMSIRGMIDEGRRY